jgi:hypothetical protein
MSKQHKLTTQVNRTSEQHKLTTEISKKSETKQSEKKQSSDIIGLLLSLFQIYAMYTFFLYLMLDSNLGLSDDCEL